MKKLLLTLGTLTTVVVPVVAVVSCGTEKNDWVECGGIRIKIKYLELINGLQNTSEFLKKETSRATQYLNENKNTMIIFYYNDLYYLMSYDENGLACLTEGVTMNKLRNLWHDNKYITSFKIEGYK